MANAISNYTAVVLTENDIPAAALERRKSAKLRRRSLCSLDLLNWSPLLVLAPLNPRPIADRFTKKSRPLNEHRYRTNVSLGKENRIETVQLKFVSCARIQYRDISTLEKQI